MSIAEKLTAIAENEQKVYEAGKKAEWDAFWEKFQKGGTRTQYPNAFAYCVVDDEFFNPKYKIMPTDAYYMFFQTNGITDLKSKQHMLDFSQCEDLRFAFFGMGDTLQKVGVIDARAGTHDIYDLQGLFNWDLALEEVEKIILKNDGSQGFFDTFNYCTALREIRFEGVIGQDINFQHCPLSKESIESVINALSSSASGKTLTLNIHAKDSAFSDSEWDALISAKSNWTISLV